LIWLLTTAGYYISDNQFVWDKAIVIGRSAHTLEFEPHSEIVLCLSAIQCISPNGFSYQISVAEVRS
jgi:hypothetical protein